MIEHRLIERMVAAIAREKDRLRAGGAVDVRFLMRAVDFMRTYADRCHHGKEEDILFKKLASKDMTVPMKQAMQRLIEDHATARGLVRRMEDLAVSCGPNADVSRDVQQVMAEIAMLYPDHIRREDKEFFPTAMTYLDPKEAQEMIGQFEDLEHRLTHDKYEEMIREVEKR